MTTQSDTTGTNEKREPKCPNHWRGCTGTMREWWGTDGHNGRERFATCRKCGATS